jgi:hypothetical protein
MSSPVSAQSVRQLAKSLRASVAPEIKHQQMLEIIANSLGWKGSALLGLLNKAGSSSGSGAEDVDPFDVLEHLAQGQLVDAYLLARRWKVRGEVERLLKAVALHVFEPLAAKALGHRAIHNNVKLTLALLATPGGGEGVLDAVDYVPSGDLDREGNREIRLFNRLVMTKVAGKMPLMFSLLGNDRVRVMVAALKADRVERPAAAH